VKAKGNGDPAVCANNLLRIFRGEVPFERVKGLDPRMIDLPANEANVSIQQDAEWLLSTYEPRANVNSVNIQASDAAAGGFIVTADITEKEG
jgi:phage baseplate assembly protein W